MIASPMNRKPFEVTGKLVLGCLIAFFLVVAGINAIMIRVAVSTFGGVETESAYKAGLAFKAETAAAQAQDARHWKVDVGVDRQAAGAVLTIAVRDAKGQSVPNLRLRADLSHPADRRRDVSLTATEVSAGVFRTQAQSAPGQWTLVVEFARNDERLFRSQSRVLLP
jgi:nitrogen fixation protein FixH